MIEKQFNLLLRYTIIREVERGFSHPKSTRAPDVWGQHRGNSGKDGKRPGWVSGDQVSRLLSFFFSPVVAS